jgi:hypothetical protein
MQTRGAEDAVGYRPQVSPVLIEPLRQLVALRVLSPA